jgi:hypothetical protein
MHIMTWQIYRHRAKAALAVLGVVGTLGACDALKVTNPASIDEADLSDVNLKTAMVNAAISDFQRMLGGVAYSGAIFTDEAVTGHNFTQWEEIDLRVIKPENTQLNSEIYLPLQRARHAGDDMSERLAELVDNPAASLEIATTRAYGGHSYVLLGEYFCRAPIAVGEDARSSDELLGIALDRFDRAIQIATAAKGAGAKAADADRILNFARVGAARAALDLGKTAEAIAYARDVPAGFVFWASYYTDPSEVRNYFEGQVVGTNHNIGVDVKFRGLNDRRVRHWANSRTGHNQKTLLWTPYQSSSFSGWKPDANVAFTRDAGIRVASGLEARYIIAEAGGMNDVELLAFLNERRAVGNQGIFAGVGADALQAELRDQRRRDFFLDGHRLGDLRRYKKLYGIDEFPSGPHPNKDAWQWGDYGSAECFVPSRAEAVGNPGYKP